MIPSALRKTPAVYVPLASVGGIPDGVVVECRWGSTVYDRAYKKKGQWFLLLGDEPRTEPSAVRVSRAFTESTG